MTVRWWHISPMRRTRRILQAIADEFTAANPRCRPIEITVLENEAFKTKLTTAMQAGDPPDVFQSWGGGVLYQYAEAGLVRDITDAPRDGRLGRVVQSGRARPLRQRRQELRRALERRHGRVLVQQGALHPGRHRGLPATWTEFLAAVSTLKAAGITPIAIGGKDKWPGHFYLGLPGDPQRRQGRLRGGLRPRRLVHGPGRSSRPAPTSRSLSTWSRSRKDSWRRPSRMQSRPDGQRQGRDGDHGPVGAQLPGRPPPTTATGLGEDLGFFPVPDGRRRRGRPERRPGRLRRLRDRHQRARTPPSTSSAT